MASESVRAVRDPLHIPYACDDFVTCFSVRSKRRDDAPTMEAVAFTLAMRRLTRSIRHHAHRHVFLLDAQALLFALRKGRSSSGGFKLQLQKAGALAVCADMLAYYGYVPTSCNPGDPPSRGVRRTMKRFREPKQSSSKWQEHVRSVRRFFRHMKSSPLRDSIDSWCYAGSHDSSSSGSLTVQPH